jgi:hypothetical protein
MKLHILSLSILFSVLVLAWCNWSVNVDTIKEKPTNEITQSLSWDTNTTISNESYSGTINGVLVSFSQFLTSDGLSTFQLTEGDKILSWNLNTERGLWEDENATIFILNFDKAENEQKRFVKLSTKSGVLFALSGNQIEKDNMLYSSQ